MEEVRSEIARASYRRHLGRNLGRCEPYWREWPGPRRDVSGQHWREKACPEDILGTDPAGTRRRRIPRAAPPLQAPWSG